MNDFQNLDCINLILRELYRNPKFFSDLNIDSKLYLKKIDKYASFEKCYVDNTLAGIVAYYCNNLESKEAFVTLVLVDDDFRGLGIAQKLMNKVIDIIRSKEFTKCTLEVSLKKPQVIRLYEKLNYVETHRNADSAFMSVLV
jgi:ribosomal protein S18 acetylase RimI-like enzyme